MTRSHLNPKLKLKFIVKGFTLLKVCKKYLLKIIINLNIKFY